MNLLGHKRFRAAYDFYVLRAEVGQADETTAKFWTDVQTQSLKERAATFQVSAQPRKRKPRRRRARKTESAGDS